LLRVSLFSFSFSLFSRSKDFVVPPVARSDKGEEREEEEEEEDRAKGPEEREEEKTV